MTKNNKENLRGKSEWRKYFEGKNIDPKQRARVLQYVEKRAEKAMDDLVLISKGLHFLTDDMSNKKAQKHRQKIFSMPLTGQCFIRLYVETKGRIKNIKEVFHQHGQEIVFDVRGYRVNSLKMKKHTTRN